MTNLQKSIINLPKGRYRAWAGSELFEPIDSKSPWINAISNQLNMKICLQNFKKLIDALRELECHYKLVRKVKGDGTPSKTGPYWEIL